MSKISQKDRYGVTCPIPHRTRRATRGVGNLPGKIDYE
jgi:hypothetical protein